MDLIVSSERTADYLFVINSETGVCKSLKSSRKSEIDLFVCSEEKLIDLWKMLPYELSLKIFLFLVDEALRNFQYWYVWEIALISKQFLATIHRNLFRHIVTSDTDLLATNINGLLVFLDELHDSYVDNIVQDTNFRVEHPLGLQQRDGWYVSASFTPYWYNVDLTLLHGQVAIYPEKTHSGYHIFKMSNVGWDGVWVKGEYHEGIIHCSEIYNPVFPFVIVNPMGNFIPGRLLSKNESFLKMVKLLTLIYGKTTGVFLAMDQVESPRSPFHAYYEYELVKAK